VVKFVFSRSVRNLVASLRGLPPEGREGSTRGERPIGGLLKSILRKIEIASATAEQVIGENWASIVGEIIANRCRPVRILNSDVLLVHSPSATVRSELQLRKSKILENLHRHPHCEKISDVRFSASA
jgi:hypothetical protein